MLVTENSTRYVVMTLLLADVMDDFAFSLNRGFYGLSSRNGHDIYKALLFWQCHLVVISTNSLVDKGGNLTALCVAYNIKSAGEKWNWPRNKFFLSKKADNLVK